MSNITKITTTRTKSNISSISRPINHISASIPRKNRYITRIIIQISNQQLIVNHSSTNRVRPVVRHNRHARPVREAPVNRYVLLLAEVQIGGEPSGFGGVDVSVRVIRPDCYVVGSGRVEFDRDCFVVVDIA